MIEKSTRRFGRTMPPDARIDVATIDGRTILRPVGFSPNPVLFARWIAQRKRRKAEEARQAETEPTAARVARKAERLAQIETKLVAPRPVRRELTAGERALIARGYALPRQAPNFWSL